MRPTPVPDHLPPRALRASRSAPSRPVALSFAFSFLLFLALFLAGAVPGAAQPAALIYSIDFQGPTAAAGTSPADLLLPGPLAFLPGTAFGLAPAPASGMVEVDAISKCSKTLWPGRYDLDFSVDEFAAGIPAPPGAPPNVASEGFSGNAEASADVFRFPYIVGNVGVFDGDGLAPFAAPALGLIEPNPGLFGIPDAGDNVDGLFYENPNHQRIYFSLDAAWMDPLEGFPVNSGTAVANGVAPGDILVYVPGAAPPVSVYATNSQLGLGPNDDLDALIVHENGDGIFQPSLFPWDWFLSPCARTDMVLFSVRRGSAVLGTLDSLRFQPIEEGDVLTVMNGGSTPPGIFMAAETLGLRTVRGGPTLPSGYADDLAGLGGPLHGEAQDQSCDPLP
ncbi:MAG: hypothetical protein MI919_03285 [Holophagales bacterium]|nr:hypothetical protein [Holophagales bacterium]